MQRALRSFFIVLAAAALHWPLPAPARIAPLTYGLPVSREDSLATVKAAAFKTDSLLAAGPLKARVSVRSLQPRHVSRNRTADFYLMLGLALILGGIRYGNPRYFALLLGAYRNPGAGRQWRDMLQAAALPNLAMNVFYAAVMGSFIYYVSPAATARLASYHAHVVMLLLVGGMLATYCVKYAVIRFSGWAFRAEALAGQYLFNVFLVNKITGIVLLPFVVVIAFAGSYWTAAIGTVAAIVAAGLLSTRYLRSWPAFYAFFKGSRFHFFTYLCASEILPMAVLVKWLLHLLR